MSTLSNDSLLCKKSIPRSISSRVVETEGKSEDLSERCGYTPQKPLRRAYEQNPKAVQKWLDKEYPDRLGANTVDTNLRVEYDNG